MQMLHGNNEGSDLFECLTTVSNRYGLPWEKMEEIITDGTPFVVGCRNGLATFVSAKMEESGGEVVKSGINTFYIRNSYVQNLSVLEK